MQKQLLREIAILKLAVQRKMRDVKTRHSKPTIQQSQTGRYTYLSIWFGSLLAWCLDPGTACSIITSGLGDCPPPPRMNGCMEDAESCLANEGGRLSSAGARGVYLMGGGGGSMFLVGGEGGNRNLLLGE